jgi:hypothetical protein
MRNALLALLLVAAAGGITSEKAVADVFIGELAANKCNVEKGKDFKKVLKDAYADKSMEVTHSKEGRCGESAYLIRTKTRRRMAVFPTRKGCECYLKMAQMLEPAK